MNIRYINWKKKEDEEQKWENKIKKVADNNEEFDGDDVGWGCTPLGDSQITFTFQAPTFIYMALNGVYYNQSVYVHFWWALFMNFAGKLERPKRARLQERSRSNYNKSPWWFPRSLFDQFPRILRWMVLSWVLQEVVKCVCVCFLTHTFCADETNILNIRLFEFLLTFFIYFIL